MAALLAACADGGQRMAGEAEPNMSHVHMGHVLTGWQDTPDQMGLLPTAQAEAEGVAQHVRFAADSEDASDNVKLHATHVETSSGNVVVWSQRIVELGQQVQAASSAGEAAPLVVEIETLTQAIVAGTDANGDGTVSWEESEGGLAQAAQHMQFM